MTSFEFYQDLRHQKTTIPALSCGVVCVILRLAVLVEHQLVTDGTDRQTTTARDKTHSDVSHSNNVSHRARSEALKTDQSRFHIARRTGQPNLALIFLCVRFVL